MQNFKNKVVLVAGAAGFVPSTLAEFYLKKGAYVIGLDNFVTGSLENISLLKKYEQFSFIECDVSLPLPEKLDEEIKLLGGLDYVFSMASPASPIDFAKIPLEIMKVNSIGTWNLLELTKKYTARFLEASTSEVYGDPEIHPQVETYWGNVNPIGHRSCYDESKRFAEALTMSYHRLYALETRIVRIFNTYGPRMRPNDGRVIPNFINQALKGEPLTVYGQGDQTRSFCYVTDLVEGIHQVMMSNDPTPFNVGNPDEYSVYECAQEIIKVLNSSSTIEFHPLPSDDPKKRRPDLSKLQSQTSYQPQVNFQEGIKETALYFKNNQATQI